MNIEFDKDLVKYSTRYDAMVASRLLRKNRRTTIFSEYIDKPRGGEVGKMNVEEQVINKFVKGFSHDANAELSISWEREGLMESIKLIVNLTPAKDVEPGSLIKIGEIDF